jgi:hypothetical protein
MTAVLVLFALAPLISFVACDSATGGYSRDDAAARPLAPGATPTGYRTETVTEPVYDTGVITISEPSVTVTRVRYDSATAAGFQAWPNNSVWMAYQDNTYIAVVWDPAASGKPVENVILLCAGQQGSSGSSDAANVVTGQKDGWMFQSAATASRSLSVKSHGAQIIARDGRIYSNGSKISKDNTFLALAFDAGFDYGWDKDQKGKIVNAYRDFLVQRAGPVANWKNVWLSGSSRGAALCVRLAEKMRASAPSTAWVLVSSIDAVGNYGEEFNIERNWWGTWPNYDNPVSSNIFRMGVKPDLGSYFSNTSKTKFYIYHIVGGANVASVSTIHAFAVSGSEYYDNGWFKQKWVDYSHTEMGREWQWNVAPLQIEWYLAKAFGPLSYRTYTIQVPIYGTPYE